MEFKTSMALIFILIFVLILVYPRKRLHNSQSKIFVALIATTFLNLIFDGITNYTVNNMLNTPFNDICHVFFILSIHAFAFLLYLYCCCHVRGVRLLNAKNLTKHIVFFIIVTILILALPITYEIHSLGNYSYGPKVFALYGSIIWYLFFVCYLLVKHSKYMERKKRNCFILSIFAVFVVGIIQIVVPSLLVSAIGITIAVVGLAITNESQEKLFDLKTELFNDYAFKEILLDILKDKKQFAIGMIDFDEVFLRLKKYTEISNDDVLRDFGKYIYSKYEKNLYRFTDSTITLISNSQIRIDEILNEIESEIIKKTKVKKMYRNSFIIDNTNGNVTSESIVNKILLFSIESSKHEAVFDSFTGVRNRNDFEMQRFDYEGTDKVYMIVDLNDLKKTNDIYGHDKGDEYLKEISSILKKVLGNSDDVYRIGGDEFALICDKDDVQRIISDVHYLVDVKNQTVEYDMQVAIGYANFSDSDYYKKADIMMYECKEKQKKIN